jgi:transposase
MTERTTRYLGLDVHKATIAVAVAEASGPPTLFGTIANEPSEVRKVVARLGRDARLMAVYEAGPTGYDLHRQLTSLGVETVVAAPSLTPIRPGDRIKTDNRDALSLARLLRSGDLAPVWVPDPEHEALRDLVRAREDAKAALMRERHHLSKFLLRQGVHAPRGGSWGKRHHQWLNQVQLRNPAHQIVFADYLGAERAAEERVRRLEGSIHECIERSPLLPLVAALQCLRGIAFLSAAIVAVEVGDFRRFKSAPQFMAYAGLVPSEHSSGASRRRGHITHTGNAQLRHVLVQAAHNARYRPSLENLRKRLEGGPPDLVQLSMSAATAPSSLLALATPSRHRQGGDGSGP